VGYPLQQGGKGKGKPSERSQGSKRFRAGAKGNTPVKKNNTPAASSNKSGAIRLNKYIANSGMCSRREADEHIAIGLVSVNGKIITEMGFKVKLEDEVRYDGARINPEQKAYVLLNKPKGFATTTSCCYLQMMMWLLINLQTLNTVLPDYSILN